LQLRVEPTWMRGDSEWTAGFAFGCDGVHPSNKNKIDR